MEDIKKSLLEKGERINRIKEELCAIGEMRPGTLSKQFQKSGEKSRGYYQLSYTLNMKSKTEYVQEEFVKDVGLQVENYKRFKKLIKEWVELAIENSRLKMNLVKRFK